MDLADDAFVIPPGSLIDCFVQDVRRYRHAEVVFDESRGHARKAAYKCMMEIQGVIDEYLRHIQLPGLPQPARKPVEGALDL